MSLCNICNNTPCSCGPMHPHGQRLNQNQMSATTNTPRTVEYVPDGDMICARFSDFENLHESLAAFGKTELLAVEQLAIDTRSQLETELKEAKSEQNKYRSLLFVVLLAVAIEIYN